MTSTSPSVSSAICGFMISSSPSDSGSSFSSFFSSFFSSGFSSSFSLSSLSFFSSSLSSLSSSVTLATSFALSSLSSLPQPANTIVATIKRILNNFSLFFMNDRLLLLNFIIRIQRHLTTACSFIKTLLTTYLIDVTAFGNYGIDTLYRYNAYYYTILQKVKSDFSTRSLGLVIFL